VRHGLHPKAVLSPQEAGELLAVPWHSRQSEPVAAHGMGAAVLSAGDRAGKPDGPPIADAVLTPARVHRESF